MEQSKKNYLTMDISEFEELPFSYEGSLVGQADPMPFFKKHLKEFIVPGDGVLIILPASEMRTAMAHVIEGLGAVVHICDPGDSYNYMLNLIHGHEGNTGDDGDAGDVTVLVGSVSSLKGLLKHSADISVSSVSRVLISDSYIPASFSSDIAEAWKCTVFEHFTRPELNGLGAFSCREGTGYHVCSDLYIEIIDPETGLGQPDGKWGEIVVTGLFPAREPMIRYRTGIVSRYIPDGCSCGDTQPLIDRVRKRGAMD